MNCTVCDTHFAIRKLVSLDRTLFTFLPLRFRKDRK